MRSHTFVLAQILAIDVHIQTGYSMPTGLSIHIQRCYVTLYLGSNTVQTDTSANSLRVL